MLDFEEVVSTKILLDKFKNKMVSPKYQLMWLDVKSWSITTFLMFLPIALGLAQQEISMHELGIWKEAVLLAIGALLKLAYKWQTNSAYVAQ